MDSQQTQSAWKRVYFDVPREVDESFAELAKERGVTKKALYASIMVLACQDLRSKHGKGKGKAR